MFDSTYIDSYYDYLTHERCASANTVSSYVRDITQFAAYLDNCGKCDFTQVTDGDIRAYLLSIENNGRSPATVSRCLVSLKAFFNRMTHDGFFVQSPAVGIAPPIAVKNAIRLLTADEIERLFDQMDGTGAKCCRDRAMLETLYATGIRVSELVALDLSDVNLATGLIFCRNGKERTIPIYAAAIKAIGAYLSFARELMASADENALFVNAHGKRLTRQGFWKILKMYSEKAQIDSYISPQTLRNSFAAHLLENGADPRSLQEMLGHADISSTMVIARAVKKQLKEVYNKTHPRA